MWITSVIILFYRKNYNLGLLKTAAEGGGKLLFFPRLFPGSFLCDIQFFEDHIDISTQFAIRHKVFFDFIHTVHDRGVVSFAQKPRHLVQGRVGVFAADIHDDLSG